MVKVITLVGMPGAGKSVCADHLKKKGWPSVYFGGVTLDEIKARGLKVNPENEKNIREDLRIKYGKEVYAKRITEQIDKLARNGAKAVIADGLYSWSEYKVFKEKYGNNAIIIAITAPRQLRHDRLTKRPTRPLTIKEANKRDYAEIENIEKGGPIANADYTLVNDRSQKELLSDLDEIIHQVL